MKSCCALQQQGAALANTFVLLKSETIRCLCVYVCVCSQSCTAHTHIHTHTQTNNTTVPSSIKCTKKRSYPCLFISHRACAILLEQAQFTITHMCAHSLYTRSNAHIHTQLTRARVRHKHTQGPLSLRLPAPAMPILLLLRLRRSLRCVRSTGVFVHLCVCMCVCMCVRCVYITTTIFEEHYL